MKIVVFCPNLIGDTVMATPTFRALRAGFPDATIVAVIKPHVAPTLDATPWFDELVLFDHRSSFRARRRWRRFGGCAGDDLTWRSSCPTRFVTPGWRG